MSFDSRPPRWGWDAAHGISGGVPRWTEGGDERGEILRCVLGVEAQPYIRSTPPSYTHSLSFFPRKMSYLREIPQTADEKDVPTHLETRPTAFAHEDVFVKDTTAAGLAQQTMLVDEARAEELRSELARSRQGGWVPVTLEEKAANRKLNRKFDLFVSVCREWACDEGRRRLPALWD